MTQQAPEIKFESNISVKLIQQVGSDQMIAAAARVSTTGIHNDGVHEQKKIEGLINYLMSHRHGTPFEHGMLTARVHAPIFVWREWHRHRVGFSYNEESGRYKELEPTFWIPRRDRPAVPAPDHTSARPKFIPMTDEQYDRVKTELDIRYTSVYASYRKLLAQTIAKEVARTILPVGIYSACYVTCNPRSLMHFLSLRVHSTRSTFMSYPQAEIQEAAEQMERLFAAHWPITYATFLLNGRVAP